MAGLEHEAKREVVREEIWGNGLLKSQGALGYTK